MKLVNLDDLQNWSNTNLAASRNGPWVNVEAAEKLSMQVTWTGTSLVGTLSFQVADGPVDTTGAAPAATATTLVGASYAMAASLIGGESSLVVSFPDVPFSWIRWVWTFTSGTGTLTDSNIVLKGN